MYMDVHSIHGYTYMAEAATRGYDCDLTIM